MIIEMSKNITNKSHTANYR